MSLPVPINESKIAQSWQKKDEGTRGRKCSQMLTFLEEKRELEES
jgi:hypothetical protein